MLTTRVANGWTVPSPAQKLARLGELGSGLLVEVSAHVRLIDALHQGVRPSPIEAEFPLM